MEDWVFRAGAAFIVLVFAGFLTGIISLAIHENNKNNEQFKRDCIALNAQPVMGRDKLCIKDSKVIFRR